MNKRENDANKIPERMNEACKEYRIGNCKRNFRITSQCAEGIKRY